MASSKYSKASSRSEDRPAGQQASGPAGGSRSKAGRPLQTEDRTKYAIFVIGKTGAEFFSIESFNLSLSDNCLSCDATRVRIFCDASSETGSQKKRTSS